MDTFINICMDKRTHSILHQLIDQATNVGAKIEAEVELNAVATDNIGNILDTHKTILKIKLT